MTKEFEIIEIGVEKGVNVDSRIKEFELLNWVL